MITKQDVRHIAKLARIQLPAHEEEQFQKELGEVLDYFEQLKEVDVSNVEPMTHSVALENGVRTDVAKPQSKEQSTRLVEMAPDTANGYIRVKSVL
jgi:aspartyl-tRNA(Asn)/glutamyl-tRNA(Gln) amidotransferase subunit C